MPLIHATAHPGVEVPDEGLPTLIALHGYGAHGQDLLGLWPYLASGRMLMICPQAPLQVQPGYFGFSWYDFAGPGGQSDPAALEGALDLVGEFLDYAFETYPVRSDRVALLGFSQGGGMAYRLAFREPERYVGLRPPSARASPRTWATSPPATPSPALPMLIQHGEQDPTATVDGGRASRDRPARAGPRSRLPRVPDGPRGQRRQRRRPLGVARSCAVRRGGLTAAPSPRVRTRACAAIRPRRATQAERQFSARSRFAR